MIRWIQVLEDRLFYSAALSDRPIASYCKMRLSAWLGDCASMMSRWSY